MVCRASQVALVVKNPPAHAGGIRDSGLISGSGRFPGGGNGTHGLSCTWHHPPTWTASSLPWAPASPGLPPPVRASSLLWLTLPFCSGHCSDVEASLAPPHSIPSGQNFLEKGRQLILVVSYYTHPSPFCRYFHVPRAS